MKKMVKGTNEATCGNLDDHLHRTERRLFRRAHLERRSGFDEALVPAGPRYARH
jgi:hypothetical protein